MNSVKRKQQLRLTSVKKSTMPSNITRNFLLTRGYMRGSTSLGRGMTLTWTPYLDVKGFYLITLSASRGGVTLSGSASKDQLSFLIGKLKASRKTKKVVKSPSSTSRGRASY